MSVTVRICVAIEPEPTCMCGPLELDGRSLSVDTLGRHYLCVRVTEGTSGGGPAPAAATHLACTSESIFKTTGLWPFDGLLFG